MGRIFTIAGEYIFTLLVFTIGFGVYGCSDSGSVNPVVELASLRVTSGSTPASLRPSFNPETTNYTVDLSTNVTSVTVSAQPAVAGDSVRINGEATTSRSIDLGAAGSTTPVNIVVSESGTNSRTYTVLLTKASVTGENSLRSLSISPGTLDPEFDAAALSYEVSVSSDATSLRVTPSLQDPAATMTVNGQSAPSGQAQTIPLREPGLSTVITIAVTAQNGTPKTYTVVVSRAALGGNNNLDSLRVSPSRLNESFSASRTRYTVNVGGRVENITVTASPDDTNARVTINGEGTNSRSIPLPVGPSSTVIQIIVIAQNGSQKPYSITVNRDALSSDNDLETLSVTPGGLNPAFASNQLTYRVEVATGVPSVFVSATKSDPNAVMSGDVPNQGQATIPLGAPGTDRVVSITVAAPNGIIKTYTITVHRLAPSTDSKLSNLTVSVGALVPSFSAGTPNYTVDVASSVDTITISATKSDPTSVMSGSVIAAAGIPTGRTTVSLGLGTITPVTIALTAQDGISRSTYTISVNRPPR